MTEGASEAGRKVKGTTKERAVEGQTSAVLYGVFCYLLFLLTFLYLIGFVSNLAVPKSIDSSGPVGNPYVAVVVNLVLLGLFGVQHSVMARPRFKSWWTQFVPPPVERSTYVLLASLTLILLFWLWRPIPGYLWEAQGFLAFALGKLGWLGWVLALASTFLINHFDLFGLSQVFAYWSGKPTPEPEFRTPAFYRVVRHPLYLGFLLALWVKPTMSYGRLLFATVLTLYILVAIRFEERDLIDLFGQRYRDYQRRVSMIVPWLPRRGT
jgi:protein-S-isoprenylcysteine O-methyltransferase Ste14